MTNRAKFWLAVGLASATGILCVVGFLTTMSPIEALSSPFRMFVTVRDVPERLRMSADATTMDRSRLADSLKRLAASEQLTFDGNTLDPRDTHYAGTSMSDKHGNQLSILKSAGQYYARVLQSNTATDQAGQLAASAERALMPLGFRVIQN